MNQRKMNLKESSHLRCSLCFESGDIHRIPSHLHMRDILQARQFLLYLSLPQCSKLSTQSSWSLNLTDSSDIVCVSCFATKGIPGDMVLLINSKPTKVVRIVAPLLDPNLPFMERIRTHPPPLGFISVSVTMIPFTPRQSIMLSAPMSIPLTSIPLQKLAFNIPLSPM